MNVSQLKELSLIIMLLRLKSSILREKSNKPSWLMSQLKRSMKEFNISQLRLKLSTILKEITTFQLKLK